MEEVNVGELVSFLKTKKFSDMRKWANSNMDTDTARIFRRLYDSLSSHLTSYIKQIHKVDDEK